MHLGVLIENMRREGYEFSVGKPRVILKNVDGKMCEPYERTAVEVPTEHAGKIIEYLGKRRGEMTHMEPFGAHTRLEFLCPSRGLIGARTAMMTLSQGEAILSHVFDQWRADGGPIPRRTNGVLISDRAGDSVPYAMFALLDRGTFFIAPGTPVYEGMIVGENNKDNDLGLNVCREKKLTNIRSAGKDENVKLPPPHIMSLEESLEYIEDDELLEVTPQNLRLRKRMLSEIERKKQDRVAARAARSEA
jgi:GTP-binding protein